MWPGFKSWTRCHMRVGFVVGSRPALREFDREFEGHGFVSLVLPSLNKFNLFLFIFYAWTLFTNTIRSKKMLRSHGDSWNSFKYLRNAKPTSKVDCFFKKMLFIRKLKTRIKRVNRPSSCYSVCLATCSVIMLDMATWRLQNGTVNKTLQNHRKRWQWLPREIPAKNMFVSNQLLRKHRIPD